MLVEKTAVWLVYGDQFDLSTGDQFRPMAGRGADEVPAVRRVRVVL